MICAKLLATLFAHALTNQPDPVISDEERDQCGQAEIEESRAKARAERLREFQDCLDDHDLEADENDWECEEP